MLSLTPPESAKVKLSSLHFNSRCTFKFALSPCRSD
jgi:hypothetical protein